MPKATSTSPGYTVPPEEQAPEGEHEPLFPFGHGLRLADAPAGSDEPLPVDTFVDTTPVPPVTGPLEVLGGAGGRAFDVRIGGHNTWSRPHISFDGPTDVLVVHSEPLDEPGRPDALALEFKGYPAFVYAQAPSGEPADLRGYAADGGAVAFDVRVPEAPTQPLYLACHDDYPAQPGLDIAPRLAELAERLPAGEWATVVVPVAEPGRIGSDLQHVDVPFMLYTEGTAQVDVSRVRWEAGKA